MARLLSFCSSHLFFATSLLVLTRVVWSQSSTDSSLNHTSIVLIGSTGDLAKKYLWQAIFDLYRSQTPRGHSFSIYGAARESHVTGRAHLQSVLESQLKCLDEDCEIGGCNCDEIHERFMTSCTYRQLTESEHYKQLCDELDLVTKETGRLFYLAVPSTVYGRIASRINSHCRPNSNAWLRVVFEKPFGWDMDSAEQLARDIGIQLSEEEIFRVDHYLGKTTMQSILKFRSLNQDWLEPYLNRHWVDRVEIVSAETADCYGRTRFYDQYGVVRDMLQNHLTEAMVLVAMDLPCDASEAVLLKDKLLASVHPPTADSCVIGQYGSYEEHVQEDAKDKTRNSSTPTFAACSTQIATSRWDGVPFVLLSGKQLPHRTAYIRIQFRNSEFRVASLGKFNQRNQPQIVLHIQGGELQTPAILISRNFHKPEIPDGWQLQTTNMSTDYHILLPVKDTAPYSTILNGVYDNVPDIGVPTSRLLGQWRLWTPLLQSLNTNPSHLIKYSADSVDLLTFSIFGNRLVGQQETDGNTHYSPADYNPGIGSQRPIPMTANVMETVLGHTVIVESSDALISRLTQRIQEAAETAIHQSGVFHLALPGGLSPIPLFHKLAFHSSSFPWQRTHIWLTDERCVPFNHSASNFGSLMNNLLNYVKLPYVNIHPIPVNLIQCNEAAKAYEHHIQAHLVNSSIDFIVLGVGQDGHTASLFPNQKSLDEMDRLVIDAVKGRDPQREDNRRVSLTYKAFKQAKELAVVVRGEGKREVMDQIRHGREANGRKYPVVRLAQIVNHMTWYVDTALWSSEIS